MQIERSASFRLQINNRVRKIITSENVILGRVN